jgi:hypothetical protein
MLQYSQDQPFMACMGFKLIRLFILGMSQPCSLIGEVCKSNLSELFRVNLMLFKQHVEYSFLYFIRFLDRKWEGKIFWLEIIANISQI